MCLFSCRAPPGLREKDVRANEEKQEVNAPQSAERREVRVSSSPAGPADLEVGARVLGNLELGLSLTR